MSDHKIKYIVGGTLVYIDQGNEYIVNPLGAGWNQLTSPGGGLVWQEHLIGWLSLNNNLTGELITNRGASPLGQIWNFSASFSIRGDFIGGTTYELGIFHNGNFLPESGQIFLVTNENFVYHITLFGCANLVSRLDVFDIRARITNGLGSWVYIERATFKGWLD